MKPFPNQKRKWSKQEQLAANNINALNLDSVNHDGTLSMNRHAQKRRENEKFKEEERKKLWNYAEERKQQQQQQKKKDESSSRTGNTTASNTK